MLKRPITYTNPFTEQEVTEEHYFHISKSDLVELELEEHGQSYMKNGEELTGLQAKLQRIVDAEDGKAILAEFKSIIKRAYGVREVTDGKERFIKSQQISDDFASSEAFSQLLFELATDPGEAATFINAVIPANLEQIAAEVRQRAETIAAGREAQATAQNGAGTAEEPTPEVAAAAPRVLTHAEASEMDSTELRNGLAEGRFTLQ